MRTTITIDDSIEPAVRSLVEKTRKSLRTVINELIRAGLNAASKDAELVSPPPFTVKPISLNMRAGIDPTRLNQLHDELEIEDKLNGNTRY